MKVPEPSKTQRDMSGPIAEVGRDEVGVTGVGLGWFERRQGKKHGEGPG